MGFFSSLFNPVKHVKKAVSTLSNPTKLLNPANALGVVDPVAGALASKAQSVDPIGRGLSRIANQVSEPLDDVMQPSAVLRGVKRFIGNGRPSAPVNGGGEYQTQGSLNEQQQAYINAWRDGGNGPLVRRAITAIRSPGAGVVPPGGATSIAGINSGQLQPAPAVVPAAPVVMAAPPAVAAAPGITGQANSGLITEPDLKAGADEYRGAWGDGAI